MGVGWGVGGSMIVHLCMGWRGRGGWSESMGDRLNKCVRKYVRVSVQSLLCVLNTQLGCLNALAYVRAFYVVLF